MASTNRPTTAVVDHASVSDIPALITIWWDAFSTEHLQRVFPQTPNGKRWQERAFEDFIGSTPGPDELKTECLVVRDPETGAAAAFAIYRIVPEGYPPEKQTWRARWPPAEGFPDMSDDHLDDFFSRMEKAHAHVVGDRGHVFLEVLATKEEFRKRGYGSALVKWGTELADQLGLECYLDASPAGKPLYEAHGYVEQDVSTIVEKQSAASMLRSKKHED
ncbi:acyl-CoA N-acyltransferase [Daldinia sp. FL1419]|nr:acyl-CoA N-acyltransferase [Daldinia sp. FL1419]